LNFSKDASKLAFTFNSAKYNSDVWTYDLRSKQLTQITKSSRSDIPQTSFVEPQLIKYKTFDGREIPAWYYVKPDNKNGFVLDGINTSRTIISVHGGPEGQERPGFNALYQYYLSRGYAILATNVRGSTGYGKTFTHLDDVQKREDSVKDLAFAVEWLKKSDGGDVKKYAVMGGSYGGYMTMAAITLYPDLFAAAVIPSVLLIGNFSKKHFRLSPSPSAKSNTGRLDRDLDFPAPYFTARQG
jgi:dipeptidyl aminopeptidase/acylaminoacyl peptidase